MRKLVYLVGIVLFSSCNMQNYCSKHYPPIARADSSTTTTTTYIPHDSAEKQQADSTYYYALIECEKNNAGQFVPVIKSQYKDERGKIKIKNTFANDTLTVNCKIDTFSVVARWNEKHVTVVSKSNKVAVQKVNYVTPMQSFWMIWGKILTVILILVAVVFAIKSFSKASWFTVVVAGIKAVVKIATKKK